MSILFNRRAPSPAGESRAWDMELLSMMQQQFAQSMGGGAPQMTYGNNQAEAIATNYVGHATGGVFSSGVVFSVERIRLNVFSSARLQWQRLAGNGGPSDLFGTKDLAIFETPEQGVTESDLLAKSLLHADLAGNAYVVGTGQGELVNLRPDWCDIVLAPRMLPLGPAGPDGRPKMVQVGYKKAGLFYFEQGFRHLDPAVFLPDEFAHFAPIPDPLGIYRGMSWLSPILREIQSDKLATDHGIAFLEHGATPNMVITLPRETTKRQFELFKAAYEGSNKGAENAYGTLLLTSGADVTPVGVNMKDLDMAKLRGMSETRIAMAGGIHPVVLGSSEGMQGSSLNAGNYNAAKRSTADTTFRPLWNNFCGSMANLIAAPAGSRLWYDERYVSFLREDLADAAQISSTEAATITQLVNGGFTAESAVAAVSASNWALLSHTGMTSVQLQTPGTPAITGGK